MRPISRWLTAVPDVVGLPILWLCLTVSTTVFLGVFHWWLVIPITLILSVLTWRWRPESYVARFSGTSTLIAIAMIAAWLVVNLPYYARYVDVTRDPGFLTLEGIWLSHHPEPGMPIGTASQIPATVPGFNDGLGPYSLQRGQYFAQGAKLTPGLVAMGGWVGGDKGVLAADMLIGAIGLLVVYALARRIVGPVWSLVAIVALGASMPMTYFSRAVFTEPTVLMVTFAGLLFLWQAAKNDRWQHYLVGGALVGAGGLARIDGAALVIGLAGGLAIFAAGTRDPELRRRRRHGFELAVGAAVLLTIVGGIELYLDSTAYFLALKGEYFALLAAAIVVGLIGYAFTFRGPWTRLRDVAAARRGAIGWVCFGLVLAVSVGLLSRPLWYFGNNSVTNNLTVGLQNQGHLTLDGNASYDQLSLNWIAMYLGWPVVIGALIGIAITLQRAIVKRDGTWLMLLGVVAGPSLLYLLRVSISPDQIWAMRRFLPITIPGFLIFGLVVVRWALAKLRRFRPPIRVVVGAIVVVGTLASAAFPFFTWGQMFTVAEHNGKLTEMEAACAAIAGRPTVYVMTSGYLYQGTLRTACDVPTVSTASGYKPTAAQLLKIRQEWGGNVAVVTFNAALIPWAGGVQNPPATLNTPETEWPFKLNSRPVIGKSVTSHLWLGTISPNGTVTPMASLPAS